MPASRRTFTHAARHCSSVPYSCSNSASVSPCMIARIDPIPCSPDSILHRFCGGRKGADWLISGFVNRADPIGDDNAEAEAAFAEHAEIIEAAPIRVGNRKSIAVAHLMGLAAVEARRPDTKAITELDALFWYAFNTAEAR